MTDLQAILIKMVKQVKVIATGVKSDQVDQLVDQANQIIGKTHDVWKVMIPDLEGGDPTYKIKIKLKR